jgi:hypothetical protein
MGLLLLVMMGKAWDRESIWRKGGHAEGVCCRTDCCRIRVMAVDNSRGGS